MHADHFGAVIKHGRAAVATGAIGIVMDDREGIAVKIGLRIVDLAGGVDNAPTFLIA